MRSTLVEMFEHNNWANAEIILACARLGDDQLEAAPPGTAKRGIRAILWHLVESQQNYLAQLTGVDHDSTWAPPQGFDALLAAARASGDGLLELARGGRQGALEKPIFKDGYRIEPWVVMLQAINHATEHRVEIKAKFLGMGLTPPRLDGWAYGRSTGGLSEARS